MSDNPVNVLQQWGKENQLGHVTLNPEGSTLTLNDDNDGGVSIPAADKVTVVEGAAAAAAPPVAVPATTAAPADAATSAPDADAATQPPTAVEPAAAQDPVDDGAPPAEKKAEKPHRHHDKDKDKHRSSRDKDKHHRSSRDKDKDKQHRHRDRDHHDHHHSKRPRSSSDHKPQAPKKRKVIDTEQLFSNLITVVDKRSAAKAKQENDQLVQALSPEGFSVTPDLLSQFRDASQAIVQNEIPVGNSASILKAAAGKDLSRILKLYMDTMQQPSKTTRSNSHNNVPTSTSSSSQTKVWRPYLVGKKPIIVVPSGMTAPITLLNAHDFFAKSMYVTRDVVMKKGTNKANLPTTFSRRVTPRLGGGTVDYELMDNPKSKLNTSKDWDRVVAVVASGQAWQFKDWPGHYSNPVRLFTSVFGFSVGMEGAKVPEELKGWACVQAKLNRDKRGLDSVTHAAFWNGLDEFMAIHKPELLPQPEN
jgi:hypothetical protein